MSNTTRPSTRPGVVFAGADTHADTIHIAVVTEHGQDLADQEFPTTVAGYAQAISFVATHGVVQTFGIEGTSSYGAGLARAARTAGLDVIEVNRPDRHERRRTPVTRSAVPLSPTTSVPCSAVILGCVRTLVRTPCSSRGRVRHSVVEIAGPLPNQRPRMFCR